MEFAEAQEIVKSLVDDLSEGEQLRLLDWANTPRANQIRQESLKINLRGKDPKSPSDEKSRTTAVGKQT